MVKKLEMSRNQNIIFAAIVGVLALAEILIHFFPSKKPGDFPSLPNRK